jgi:hypothetical protein
MTDQDKVSLAFDMLEDAEVMQEFDDSVWIKVDKELWEAFNTAPPTEDFEPDCLTPLLMASRDELGKLVKDAGC